MDLARLVHLQPVELHGDAVEVAGGDPPHDVLEEGGRDRRGEMALGGRALPTRGSRSAAARKRWRSCATSWSRRATRCSGASFADGRGGGHRQGADARAPGAAPGVEGRRHRDPQPSLEGLDVDQAQPQRQRGGLDAHRPVVHRRHLDGVLVPDRDLQVRGQRGEGGEAGLAQALDQLVRVALLARDLDPAHVHGDQVDARAEHRRRGLLAQDLEVAEDGHVGERVLFRAHQARPRVEADEGQAVLEGDAGPGDPDAEDLLDRRTRAGTCVESSAATSDWSTRKRTRSASRETSGPRAAACTSVISPWRRRSSTASSAGRSAMMVSPGVRIGGASSSIVERRASGWRRERKTPAARMSRPGPAAASAAAAGGAGGGDGTAGGGVPARPARLTSGHSNHSAHRVGLRAGLVFLDPRLDHLLHQRGGDGLADRELDRRDGLLVRRELVLERGHQALAHHVEADVVLQGGKATRCPWCL